MPDAEAIRMAMVSIEGLHGRLRQRGQNDLAEECVGIFLRLSSKPAPDKATVRSWDGSPSEPSPLPPLTPFAVGPVEELNEERLARALWGLDFSDPEITRTARKIADAYRALGPTPRPTVEERLTRAFVAVCGVRGASKRARTIRRIVSAFVEDQT